MEVVEIFFIIVAVLGILICLAALIVQHKHLWSPYCCKEVRKPLLADVHIDENREKAKKCLSENEKMEAFNLYKINARSIAERNQLNHLTDVDFDFRGMIPEEAVAILPEIMCQHENGSDTIVIETPANALRPNDTENDLRKVIAKWLEEKRYRFDERFPGVFRISLIRTIS